MFENVHHPAAVQQVDSAVRQDRGGIKTVIRVFGPEFFSGFRIETGKGTVVGPTVEQSLVKQGCGDPGIGEAAFPHYLSSLHVDRAEIGGIRRDVDKSVSIDRN